MSDMQANNRRANRGRLVGIRRPYGWCSQRGQEHLKSGTHTAFTSLLFPHWEA